MTEFDPSDGSRLRSMLESDIARIFHGPLLHLSTGPGISRCELYLVVDDLAAVCSQ